MQERKTALGLTHARALSDTILKCTDIKVDVTDAAGLKSALTRVQSSIHDAEANVVAIVEEEYEAIWSVSEYPHQPPPHTHPTAQS